MEVSPFAMFDFYDNELYIKHLPHRIYVNDKFYTNSFMLYKIDDFIQIMAAINKKKKNIT